MSYESRTSKISQFTAGTPSAADTIDFIQSGINKRGTIQQILDLVASVYGASLRTYEFESELVEDDIQLGEYAIVEENNYSFYKITNIAAEDSNIALDSGLTAEFEIKLKQENVHDSVADLIASSPSTDSGRVIGYYDGWQDTDAGPKGGFSWHKTGGTNSSPTVGTAVSAASIGGGDGTGSTTGQSAQAGYFWTADGAEWRISDDFLDISKFGGENIQAFDDLYGFQSLGRPVKPKNYVELLSIVSAFMAKLGKKPDYRKLITDKVMERVNNPFRYIDPRSLKAINAESIILGNIKNHQGTYLSADPYMLVYVESVSSDAHTFEFSVNEIDGADVANITAKIVRFNSLGGTFVDHSTMSESSGTFTGSATGDGTDYYGIQIEYAPTSYSAGEKLELYGFSATTNSEEFFVSSTYRNVMCSISANNNINAQAFFTEVPSSGLNMVHYGIQSGNISRALYVAVSGGVNLPTAVGSFSYTGNSWSQPLNYISASAQQRVIAGNGLEAPAIIYEAGDYPLSGQAGIYNDGGSIISEGIYACLDGDARFLANSTNLGVVRCATARAQDAYLDVYMLNITSDDQHDRPTIFQTCNVYALECDINGSGASREGWELLSCNYYLQECEARDSGNDGFNLHDYLGYGAHGVLVDCISEDNGDDGFSPHEDTSYEVWGGTYQNNGKANIIPAFGAKGFCVGVTSTGATGLSTRVTPINWGGFVALSADTNDTDTIMWCINCSSDDDTHGYNASGNFSNVYVVNSTSENNTNGVLNASWVSLSSGQSGEPGHVLAYNLILSGNTNDYNPGNFLKFDILPREDS